MMQTEKELKHLSHDQDSEKQMIRAPSISVIVTGLNTEIDEREEADVQFTEDQEGVDDDGDADTFDRSDTKDKLESFTKKTKAEKDEPLGTPKLSDVQFAKLEAKDRIDDLDYENSSGSENSGNMGKIDEPLGRYEPPESLTSLQMDSFTNGHKNLTSF